MELDFSSEQEELRDGVKSFLARECPMTFVRGIVEAGRTDGGAAAAAITAGLWDQMVELGWPALTVPESAGGLGLGAVELAVVAEELGIACAPGPLLPTSSQFIPAILQAGSAEQIDRFLGPVAEGTSTGTLAVSEAIGSFTVAGVTTTATPQGDGWVLHGEKHFVVGAPSADEIVVIAREPNSEGDAGVIGIVVPASECEIKPVNGLDASRELGTVTLNGVHVSADRALGGPGPESAAALTRAVNEATTMLATEMVGTAQTVFNVILDYAKQREQFGVPIGSFQAIKHKFADFLLLLERARAMCYFAALTIAEDDDRRAVAAAMAKAAAGDLQKFACKEGIQVLGGIGYTWEHDMHLYVRRLKTGAALFGTASTHKARVADLIGV